MAGGTKTFIGFGPVEKHALPTQSFFALCEFGSLNAHFNNFNQKNVKFAIECYLKL